MCYYHEISARDRAKIIETYHQFSDKYVTIEMIKAAHKNSGCGLNDCKKILNDYIKELENHE